MKYQIGEGHKTVVVVVGENSFIIAGRTTANLQYLWSGDESTATEVLWVLEHEEEVDVTNEDAEKLIPASVFHTHMHTTFNSTFM